MLKTRITDLFGIQHPVVQGGMRYVARAELAAAVSSGGGLGIISAHTMPDGEALLAEIARARALTDAPIGVNLTILTHLKGANPDDYVDAIVQSGIRIVETAGANPAKYIARLKDAGITVLHKCTSIRFALKAQSLGADAISLTGFEAGGHPGEDQVPGLVLIPRAAESLRIPFIASGGFATGRQLAAALALGADGVNMGSRFMLTRESPMHPSVQHLMLDADERQTRIILRSIGDSTRVVANEQAEKILRMEAEGGYGADALLSEGGGPRWIAAAERGDASAGAFAAGLSIALIGDLPSASEIPRRIVAEAEACIAKLPALIAEGASA